MDSNGDMIVWMEGFDQICKHPYNDFLFAKVNLASATATPLSCIPNDVTVQVDIFYSHSRSIGIF
jgi:hypothetical protein